MPLADDVQQRAIAALERVRAHPVQATLNVQQMVVIIGALQLALRHPAFPATTGAFIKNWLDEAISQIGTLCPELAPLLRAGNDPAHDVPIERAL